MRSDVVEGFGVDEIVGGMRTGRIGRKVRFFEVVDSTNVRAKEDAEDGAVDGTLIVADMQTAGRGRRGREWKSPAGANVYFSLLLKPDFAPDKASMLTLVMAYAVKRGLEETCTVSMESGIKWPNDIVVNGKKICGILTEMVLDSEQRIKYVVIGVGINVGKQEFAPEIVDTATCIEEECGYKVSRSSLIANIMAAFEEQYDVFLQKQSLGFLREEYNACLVNCNREVCVLDPKGEYRGIARGINDSGELLVELPDGSVQAVYAGEVSVRGIYGYV